MSLLAVFVLATLPQAPVSLGKFTLAGRTLEAAVPSWKGVFEVNTLTEDGRTYQFTAGQLTASTGDWDEARRLGSRRSIVDKHDERRFLAFDPALDVDDKLTIEEALKSFAEKWIEIISQEGSHSPPDCSFCGRSSSEVQKLVAGPRSYICNDCIELCADMVKGR